MALLGFLFLTAVPVALGVACGRRYGAAGVLRWCAKYAFMAGLGSLTAIAALCGNWFWPFGLLTPFVLGAAVSSIVMMLPRRRIAVPEHLRSQTVADPIVGAFAGLAAAIAGWLLLPLCLVSTSGTEPGAGSANSTLAELAGVAHRGLLRHLPMVGDVSDEVAALLEVVNAPQAAQQQLAREHGLGQLLDVPAMQEALADDAVRRDIEELRGGSMLALYRLQSHPRVVAVAECAVVRRVFDNLRPTALAASLRGITVR